MAERSANVTEPLYKLAGGVCAATYMSVHSFVQREVNKAGGVDPNALEGRFLYNSGDLGDGFLVPTILDATIRVIGVRSSRWRNGITTALGAGIVIWAETVGEPEKFFGRPTIEDMPAGLLGVACYLGLSLWAQRQHRRAEARLNPQNQ